jgi:NADPH:quinone reductase-like Zn-dependent oxidoreductase
VPHDWSDTLAAGLGLLSWTTVALAMSKPDALALCGKPSTPVTTAIPVLVYGGGTATGVVAIQMLKQYVIPVPPNWSRHRLPTDCPSLSLRSGYTPIVVCSDQSAARAMACGALGTASYRDPHCVQKVLKLANGMPIKHCLDCITQPDSVEICFAALARVGAHYTCLEDCPEAWRPRRSVKVSVIMVS